MFNGNNRGRARDDRASAPAMAPLPGNGKRGMFSVLGPDMAIVGNVHATADLHIDGRVEGDVACATLAQGADSQIFGNVSADVARIAGTIEGSVRIKQLTVERSARITGDVEYETITIENGGHVDGRLKHMSAASAAAISGPRPVEIAPVAEQAA